LRFPGGIKNRALTEDLILHQAWQKHQQWDKVLPIHQSAKREKGIQGMPGPAPKKKCSHHPSNKPRFCRTFNEQRHH
jgi:hypothetical protein